MSWFSALQRPIFDERYLIAALPPFLLLIASLWNRPPVHRFARLLLALLLVALVALSAQSLRNHYSEAAFSKTRGWRTLVTTIDALSAGLPAAQIRIAQNFPDPTLWYYYRGPVEHIVLPPARADEAGANVAVDALEDAGVLRVILPEQPTPLWDDGGIAAQALSLRFQPALTLERGVWPVRLYTGVPTTLQPLDTLFANDVTLADAAVTPETLIAGSVLTVHLNWLLDGAELTGSEKVFVQLLDPAGVLVGQQDTPLARSQQTSGQPAVYAIEAPQTLIAGEYRLIAGLYDPSVAGAPRILTTGGQDHVELMRLAAQ